MEIPDSWKKAGTVFSRKGEIVLVIGKTDSGKSTLVSYLMNQCLEQGHRVGIVDTDIGQARFGPPACMSLTLWRDPVPPEHPMGPPVLRFIGTTNPARRLLQVVVGAKLLVEKAREKNADTVLMDTGGLVQGPLGLQLKQHKMELIKPTRVMVLQRGRELEALLRRLPSLPGMTVHRLTVSSSAKIRSPGERRAHRQRQYAEYFKACKTYPMDGALLRKLPLKGKPTDGILVGLLNGSGKTLGLGVIRGKFANEVNIVTPIPSMKQVHDIQPSTVNLNTDWEEISKPPNS